jgi:hypothetical protein
MPPYEIIEIDDCVTVKRGLIFRSTPQTVSCVVSCTLTVVCESLILGKRIVKFASVPLIFC